ncbi:uncharacterized protein [Hemitrygon akajei]|uniref:uncharacterized protein isoform X2 n=1 Tax=Hemitrygon akajei TaxID=2704970 RepID=UPI003BF9D4E6
MVFKEEGGECSEHSGDERDEDLGRKDRRLGEMDGESVECYGQGQIHHNIMKKLNIIEKPGAPLVLFVYKVSRETEDLRNALQWIKGSQRRRDDICTVILLEKSSDKQKVSVEVAHQGTFSDNTVVVRILWEQQWNSSAKIHHSPNNRVAMAKVKKRIMECKVEKTFQSKPQRLLNPNV